MVVSKVCLYLYQQITIKCLFKIHDKMKTLETTISDFRFSFAGYGHYKVTYTSPLSGKRWSRTLDDMPLIDATKNADEPKRKDLIRLKEKCKA